MSVPRSAHDRRNAERRRVRESLAKKRKKNTPPPSGAARRPGARSAPASKLERARPAHAVPASVDISTRAQAGGSTRCCQLCDARFVVSSGAVRYFEKARLAATNLLLRLHHCPKAGRGGGGSSGGRAIEAGAAAAAAG